MAIRPTILRALSDEPFQPRILIVIHPFSEQRLDPTLIPSFVSSLDKRLGSPAGRPACALAYVIATEDTWMSVDVNDYFVDEASAILIHVGHGDYDGVYIHADSRQNDSVHRTSREVLDKYWYAPLRPTIVLYLTCTVSDSGAMNDLLMSDWNENLETMVSRAQKRATTRDPYELHLSVVLPANTILIIRWTRDGRRNSFADWIRTVCRHLASVSHESVARATILQIVSEAEKMMRSDEHENNLPFSSRLDEMRATRAFPPPAVRARDRHDAENAANEEQEMLRPELPDAEEMLADLARWDDEVVPDLDDYHSEDDDTAEEDDIEEHVPAPYADADAGFVPHIVARPASPTTVETAISRLLLSTFRADHAALRHMPVTRNAHGAYVPICDLSARLALVLDAIPQPSEVDLELRVDADGATIRVIPTMRGTGIFTIAYLMDATICMGDIRIDLTRFGAIRSTVTVRQDLHEAALILGFTTLYCQVGARHILQAQYRRTGGGDIAQMSLNRIVRLVAGVDVHAVVPPEVAFLQPVAVVALGESVYVTPDFGLTYTAHNQFATFSRPPGLRHDVDV